MIGRYDIESRSSSMNYLIDESLYRGPTSLYSTSYNYYDFSVDENGLWLIYAYKPTSIKPAIEDMLVIVKLEPNQLDFEKTWNITVGRRNYCNGFISQGIFYLLESCTDEQTSISYAYNLYQNEELTVDIPFKNVFKSNRMLSYDYLGRRILAWDYGRVISYPVATR